MVSDIHIGVIMDGNRRYAKLLMKSPNFGHKFGAKVARKMLNWIPEINKEMQINIRYITAYTLSIENFSSRPKDELNFILNQISNECDSILNNESYPVNRHGFSVRFIGRIEILPQELQRKIKLVEEKTKTNRNYFLNLAVVYGGQQEIADAVKKIIDMKPRTSEEIEQLIKDNLYTPDQPFPDLIIRTGGEKRLSNFLTFQSAYSELIFTEKRWPEITKNDMISFLEEYKRRKRTFGK